MALKQRKLPAGPCTCETWGQLCNSCNHPEQVAECVSGLNILFWGFFTWCMELCLEFSPLRLQLICVYQNEVVELGNKHFVLIYSQCTGAALPLERRTGILKNKLRCLASLVYFLDCSCFLLCVAYSVSSF